MAKNRPLMTAADVDGFWAIIPTPAKEGADRWDATGTVDVDETARVVEELIAKGVNGILTMGTLGEVATLTWPEKQAFMTAAVETARGRVPVFVGTSTLNTRDTIEQTRWASDIGADGTMLGPPFWCLASIDTAVQFFKDVAEACPDMAIAIYANMQAFKFAFSIPFWARVSQIPQVITAKLTPVPQMHSLKLYSGGRIRFMPIDNDYYTAARSDPEFFTAFWSSSASCGPDVCIALRDRVIEAKKTGDWSSVSRLSDEMDLVVSQLFPAGGPQEFATYNIILEKHRMNVAGWMNAGPTRPPYNIAPPHILECAEKSGSAWAKLNRDVIAGAI